MGRGGGGEEKRMGRLELEGGEEGKYRGQSLGWVNNFREELLKFVERND